MKASGCPSASRKRAPSPALICADLGHRDVGRLRRGAEAVGLGRRHGADDLVVVAAGERGLEHGRLGGEHRLAPHRTAARARPRSRPRPARRGTAWRNRRPGRRTHPSPPRRACAPPRPARCAAAAADSATADAGAARRSSFHVAQSRSCAARARARRRRCVPVTNTRSPGLAPARRTMVPSGTLPNMAIEIVIGPGVRSVSPPNSGQPKASASSRRPSRETGEPVVADLLRQRQRQQEAERLRALGGEIGQIHPQRLARHVAGRHRRRKKCTPPMMASVLSTRSQPGGGLMKAASSASPSAPGWVAIGWK